MKKLLSLLALLVMLPLAAMAQATDPCAPAESYSPIASRYSKGLFFRIEKCGQATSYIVGTIHLDDPATMKIFGRLETMLPQVARVGFEFVDDERTPAIAASYMFFPATSPKDLTQLVTPEEFVTITQVLQQRAQFPAEAVKRIRPWAASILMQFPVPVADGISLDKRLQGAAQKAGKQLFGLETPQEQYDVFAGIPEAKQVTMLRDTIAEMDGTDALNNAFLQAYLAEDLNKLHELADDSFAMNTDAELRAYLESHLLNKRNGVMVRRLVPQLMLGQPTLTAVGALHLMGEEGVLILLEKEGFRIYPE